MTSELPIAIQQDLVYIINSSMKTSLWCSATAKETYRLLGVNREGTEKRKKRSICHGKNPCHTCTLDTV